MIGVMPCSGACNVGQMSTKAVVEAIQRRPGEIGFVCALGLPLQIPGIVRKAPENYDHHIAVNGCIERDGSGRQHRGDDGSSLWLDRSFAVNVACATKALQSVDVEPEASLLVTDAICYEKNGDLADETRLPELVQSVLAVVDQAASPAV